MIYTIEITKQHRHQVEIGSTTDSITKDVVLSGIKQNIYTQLGIDPSWYSLRTMAGNCIIITKSPPTTSVPIECETNNNNRNEITPLEMQIPSELSIGWRLVGGKGGFGANLKKLGSKLGKQTTNFDECRDLSGRRLRTLNQARQLADLELKERELKKTRREKEDAKINAAKLLREQYGDIVEDKTALFDDSEFMRDRIEMQQSVRDAVQSVVTTQKTISSSSSSSNNTRTSSNNKSSNTSSNKSKTVKEQPLNNRNIKKRKSNPWSDNETSGEE